MDLQKPYQIYRYIVDYKTKNDGNSPSYRQIMAACKVSGVSMVHFYIGELQAKKMVRMLHDDNRRNGIIIVGGQWNLSDESNKTPAQNPETTAQRL